MDWVLFGPPGCGKGTQAERLSEAFDLYHFSTGDVLRDNVARGTELGRQAEEIMNRGELVSDDVIIAMVRDRLADDDAGGQTGVLFDGFPRTIPQAEALDGALESLGREVAAVLALDAPDGEIVERLLKRGRPDDTEETIRARLDVYREQTEPVMDYYRRDGRLERLDGVGTIEEVEQRLRQAIEGRR